MQVMSNPYHLTQLRDIEIIKFDFVKMHMKQIVSFIRAGQAKSWQQGSTKSVVYSYGRGEKCVHLAIIYHKAWGERGENISFRTALLSRLGVFRSYEGNKLFHMHYH